ncbi:glycerophosphodiester phosphodiesterase [Tranquillimonas alkanivorans]|uniref:Glycerophosphoryl diester phosphodiesterase n=1 Tax=Tranquillimonas alkanivorans TaxID=441119 RepID=A0A1I5RWK6_9RHOB|nr:glycerophosphodiester phosphodiesterase [Tranquillimonas alkanivorans]SFP62366.1 glycerophosphoryl diester phosphodiesterase [Tranquillimonas alkanivorans]
MRPAATHPFLDHPHPLAFAHRGAAGPAEENTMPAIERAVALGYVYIETDVQATRDGVAVLFHDETLERLLRVPGRVRDLTWDELRNLRMPSGASVARLDDVMRAFPDRRFNLDAKTDAAVEPMARTIADLDACDRVCVGSFSAERTARLRELLGGRLCWSPARGGIARLWLAGWGLPMPNLRFHAAQIPPEHRGIPLTTRRVLRAAHRRGIQVHVWTIDAPDEMERLLDLGVDGLMTDRPEVLKDVLVRRGQWGGD